MRGKHKCHASAHTRATVSTIIPTHGGYSLVLSGEHEAKQERERKERRN